MLIIRINYIHKYIEVMKQKLFKHYSSFEGENMLVIYVRRKKCYCFN